GLRRCGLHLVCAAQIEHRLARREEQLIARSASDEAYGAVDLSLVCFESERQLAIVGRAHEPADRIESWCRRRRGEHRCRRGDESAEQRQPDDDSCQPRVAHVLSPCCSALTARTRHAAWHRSRDTPTDADTT